MILTADIRRKAFRTPAGEHTVLADLRFALEDREIVAIVGPSGCGKTTLLKIVGGLDRDFDGELHWCGGAQPRTGTVFQQPRLLPWLSVWDNLMLPPDVDATLAAQLLETLGLTPYRDTFASRLSLGMARRLALARAFAIRPALLLMDEPFVSLDEAAAERSRDSLIQTWTSHPVAALLVTHALEEAAHLADRALILTSGPARVVTEFIVPPDLRRAGPEAAREVAAELRRAASGR